MANIKIGDKIRITRGYNFKDKDFVTKIESIGFNGYVWAKPPKEYGTEDWIFSPSEYKKVTRKPEKRVFSTYKFLTYGLSLHCDKTNPKNVKFHTEDYLRSLSMGWPEKCEGKTVDEIEKMGFSCDDGWTVSARQYRRMKNGK